MSDYISREDAVDELQVKVFHNLTDEYYGTMQVLTELPAADVAPVVHGRWVDSNLPFGYFANCSVCGYQMDVHAERGYFNFCPNCGAKMDREE